MTTLAERMIRRTRTPLSAVEPLFVSRYASRGSESDPSTISLRETTSFSEIESGEAFARRDPQSLDQPTAVPSKLHVSTSQKSLPVSEMTPSPVQQEQALVPRMVRQNTNEMLLRGIEEQSTDTSSSALPKSGSAAMFQALGTTPASTKNGPLEARKASPQPEPFVSRPTARSTSRQPASAQTQESPFSTPAPEIVISIGHIEVHAAQAPERPRRPPFRPRVSLNDFLSQKQGDRS